MGNEMSGGVRQGHAGYSPGPGPGQQGGPPPVSEKSIAKYLTPIKVTADDLLEETNKECVVCLGDQMIGDPASKLPCGHLFHVGCVEQWLRLHCTCPVCRFELETDDNAYEKDRKNRMMGRKLRYRREELSKKSITALKEMMAGFNINALNCVDKIDLVDRLIESGHIEVVEGSPALEMTESTIRSKSVRDLREMLLSFGLPTEGAIEKRELIERLVDSGRVVMTVDMEVLGETIPCAAPHEPPEPPHVTLSSNEVEAVLRDMNAGDLARLLASNGICTVGAVEKSDYIKRFMESGMHVPNGKQVLSEVGSEASALGQCPDVEMDVEPEINNNGHGSAMCGEFTTHATSAVPCLPAASGSKPNTSYSQMCSSPDAPQSQLSVRELKDICAALGVDISGCLDKADIVVMLRDAGHCVV